MLASQSHEQGKLNAFLPCFMRCRSKMQAMVHEDTYCDISNAMQHTCYASLRIETYHSMPAACILPTTTLRRQCLTGNAAKQQSGDKMVHVKKPDHNLCKTQDTFVDFDRHQQDIAYLQSPVSHAECRYQRTSVICTTCLLFYQHCASSLPGVQNLLGRQSYWPTVIWQVAGATLMCKNTTNLAA